MEPISLVASDIDGTLLLGGATAIDPEIFEQIRRLKQKGIAFYAASGRQYTSLRRLFAPVADEILYICENGAISYRGGAPVDKTPMDRALCNRLIAQILARGDSEVLISGADTSYLIPKSPKMVDRMRYFTGNNVAVVSHPDEIPEEIIKVSAFCPDGAVAAEPEFTPVWSPYFHVAIAGEAWVDLTLADKGSGLRAVCRALGIPLARVMAFGDNYNDLPMLEAAGRPYLMAGAAGALLRLPFPHCANVLDILRTL